MADTVRYMMEEMVPELEDMVKQQYFSKQEVKQIVKRRQDFEYLLKRRAALKEDFLRYIEYESKLEELRQHRRKSMDTQGKKKTLADYAIVRRIHFIFERAVRKFKSDLTLWTAWLEYCRASNSNRRLGRVVGRALQVHPTEPGLWVYAAAWEFEHNANPAAARALMQQGLRMCKHSEKMWLDYFDMELMYVEKLVARRRILGLDVPNPQDQQQQQQQTGEAAAAAPGRKRQRLNEAAAAAGGGGADEGHADAAAAAGEDPEDGEGPESEADREAAEAEASTNLLKQQQQQPTAPAQDPQAAVTAILTGAVARLVYRNALKAAACSKGGSSNYLKAPTPVATAAAAAASKGLSFRAGFLDVLQRYKSPGISSLRQEVLDGIRQDFPEDPEAADLLARSACDPCDPCDPAATPEAIQQAVQEYERLLTGGTTGSTAVAQPRQSKRHKASAHEAVQQAVQLPKAAAVQLYSLYCRYLSQRLDVLLADECSVMAAAACAQQLFKLMLQAHAAGAADVALYQLWVSTACRLKQNKVALKAARLACDAHPTSAAAWQQRLQLEVAALAPSSKTGSSSSSVGDAALLSVMKQALQQVPIADAASLWQQAFELYGHSPEELQQLQQLLLAAITRTAVRGPATGGLGAVAGSCLAVTWQVQGAAAARALWKKLQLLPPAGGDMFGAMIQQELAAAAAGHGSSSKQVTSQQLKDKQQQQVVTVLPIDVLQRVRALYDAWVAAYGSADVGVWVQYALFEQQYSRQGPGRVYWRAVKELEEPDDFIQEYRSRVGLV